MSFQQFTLIELFEIFHCTYCLSRVCWIYVYQTIRRDKLPNPSTSNLSDAREKSLKISMHTLNGIRQSENCILLIYLISPSHEVCFWFVPSTSNAFRDWTNIGYKSIFICRWIIENRKRTSRNCWDAIIYLTAVGKLPFYKFRDVLFLFSEKINKALSTAKVSRKRQWIKHSKIKKKI